MKNYTEMLKKIEDVKGVENLLENVNNSIKDNEEFSFDLAKLNEIVKGFNDENKDEFSENFVLTMDIDRKKAFEMLLSNPSYEVYSVNFKDNAYELTYGKRLFHFKDLEKCYQLAKSTDNNKKGEPIRNTSVTIFDALRFYGLTSVFLRNLQKSVFEIDTDNAFNLENVVVDNEKIFKDIDGKVFESNSNNSLEKQLNIIVKFFGYNVQMLKKDLPILKIKAQKINQDRESARFKVNAIIDDNAVLKFADVIFGVVASRIKGKDIEIITTKEENTTK